MAYSPAHNKTPDALAAELRQVFDRLPSEVAPAGNA